MGGSSKQQSSNQQNDKSTNIQLNGAANAPVTTGNNNTVTYQTVDGGLVKGAIEQSLAGAEMVSDVSADNTELLTNISNNQTDVALKQSELTLDAATGLFSDATDLQIELQDGVNSTMQSFGAMNGDIALASMDNQNDITSLALEEMGDANASALSFGEVALDNNTDLALSLSAEQTQNNENAFYAVDSAVQGALGVVDSSNGNLADLASASIAASSDNLNSGFSLAETITGQNAQLAMYSTQTVAEAISESAADSLAQSNNAFGKMAQFMENSTRSDGAMIAQEQSRNTTILLSVAVGGAALIGLALVLRKKGK